mgnify:CR=1 FL=1
MGIFSRIADIFKANVNDALDRAEDPEKMLKQMVLEMEESVNKATFAVAQAIANEKSLERKIAKAQDQSRDWQQKALQALQAGREDLARAALEKKAIADRNAADLQPIYEQAKATTAKPDLILMDVRMPKMTGYEACEALKAQESTRDIPIVFLSAKGQETEINTGLELGADDYIVKPFSPKELIARVKALLRRVTDRVEEPPRIESGDIVLDLQKHVVTVKGAPIDLTSTEFRILHLLMARKGWVFSRDKILDHLWGDEKTVLDRTVDVHIKHLREKLGPSGDAIKNVRGVGYKLEE